MAATSIRTKEWSLKKREVRAQRYFVCSVSARRGCSLRLIPGEEESLVGLLVTIAISVEATGVVVLADLSTPLRWGLYPPEVVIVQVVASGWVVQGAPLWCDEGVGPVWRHK